MYSKALLASLALAPLGGLASPTTWSSISHKTHHNSTGYENAVYFADWDQYGKDVQVDTIEADKISHLIFAFANFDSTGHVTAADPWGDIQRPYDGDSTFEPGNNVYGLVKQLYLMKKTNRNMKVVLSIGGWTYREKFGPMCSTEVGRLTFARTAVSLIKDWGFDGIDIDWEFPSTSEEKENFTLLLQALRDEMDSYSAGYADRYHFHLSVALPPTANNLNFVDMPAVSNIVDRLNMMAYGYTGSWSPVNGHSSNLYSNPNNTDATPFSNNGSVHGYLATGAPAEKIILGNTMFGQAFQKTAGLGKSFTGIGTDQWGTPDSGTWSYSALPKPGATVHWDEAAAASYTYNNATQELISYDSARSMEKKVEFVKKMGLAGCMFWEHAGDKFGEPDSLVNTVYEGFGGLAQSDNLLSYPRSVYDNIRNGME